MIDMLQPYNFWHGQVAGCGYDRPLYRTRLKKLNHAKTIITVSGGRRVGKSFIVRQFIRHLIETQIARPEQIFYANLFIRELSFLKNPDTFLATLKAWKKRFNLENSGRLYLIIDEVQEIMEWERLISSLYEDYTNEYKIILTGSNSKLLSGELHSYLAGRSYELTIYPLSFPEYADFMNKSCDRALFLAYFQDGGMPEVVLAENDFAKNNLVAATIDSIIMRDIVARHEIRNIALLRKLVDYFSVSAADEVSTNRITNILKKDGDTNSAHTVGDYIEYLKEAFFLHECPQFSYQKNDRLQNLPKKFYLNDPAFAQRRSQGSDLGKILENLVFIELLRRGYRVHPLRLGGKEVDFMAEQGHDRHYFQVAYSVGAPQSDLFMREFGNLLKIRDHYPKMVLSLDELRHAPVDGVRHESVVDFMAGKI
jgi:predicted AAA+ superfamily ATPase